MSLVQLDGITKYYGDKLVFDQITAAVERGDKIGLVGPNGAGKTTLLEVIVEEILPDSGLLRKANQCPNRLSAPAAGKNVGCDLKALAHGGVKRDP